MSINITFCAGTIFKPHPSLQHLVHNIMVSGNKVPMSQESLITPFPPLPQHALYFYIHDPVGTQFFGEAQFVRAQNV